MKAGAEFGIKPCGLGARNTLRLEAAMALYGHELDATISPLEARLEQVEAMDAWARETARTLLSRAG